MLVIMGGLPGAGKSTICRAVSRQTGAVHLRIDSIEQAVVDSGLTRRPVGAVGYCVGYALAGDFLTQGLVVVADSVNPVAATREAWRHVATATGAELVEVEIICSDRAEHRRRAESRDQDIPGLTWPTWEEITSREYEPWPGTRLTLDTAALSVDDATARLVQEMARPTPA